MKNKLVYLIIPVILISLLFTACSERTKITDEAAPFYAEALASLLWCGGYSCSVELIGSPEIRIIEEDSFGRVLFEYSEGSAHINITKKEHPIYDYRLSAVLIAQKYDSEYVYYYPEINFKCRNYKKY